MLIGYARVSTSDQDLSLQLDALKAAGCEKIYTDKASGATQAREGLTEALAYARAGDSLVVWKLDRLGRSVKGLVDMAATLAERKVDLRSLTDGIDTKGAAGRFFFHVMAALAEMERELIRERTLAGLDAAKRAGKVGGRKRAMTPAKVEAAQRLLDSGMAAKDVASSVGVSVPTFYRHFPAGERDASA
ncbi:DNA-invertase hin [Paraburkholderia aspalathi]|jgi:DNA invertase Pin-like site-specific DNA recombinase|uniref:DNA-invertase hin n=1 Tax=Paraburkholderia aspalathi TaxID=1324617 RepID=A0ABM8SPY5_9BURK|nr:recombinase family protein [Paraburkholderia aspalathi]MBK3822260.1 recombinase family protein [Paraburkholderia aspalathi]MBK3834080.1 recombinase family protein [Paraburkholderia aspalathi]MBK3863776.1 recombinase family protein [Paraburkholderia aspalathi]CAE6824155.1 DNA-invertase hin [Paraburkholderia aspalathi]